MTTIITQLDQALDDILRASTTGLDVNQAADELMYVLAPGAEPPAPRIVDAVAAMRLAMTDPSCVERLDGDRPVLSSEFVGRTAYADPTGQAAIVKNAARTQHRDLVKAISVLASKASVVLSSIEGDTAGASRALRTVTMKAGYVASMVTRWRPRNPSAKELAEAGEGDPGCISCARTEVHPGIRRWEPVASRGMCEWCFRFSLKTGNAPTLQQLETHHSGKRVMVKA